MKDLVIPGSVLLFARRFLYTLAGVTWLFIAVATATGGPAPAWLLPLASTVVAAHFIEKALQ